MENQNRRSLEEKIANPELINWKSKLSNGLKNYLVDTSAKVGTYVIPMALMEASRSLNLNEIIQSRTSVALIDAITARIYGKSLNYTRKKFNPELKVGFRGYIVDTSTMLAVYVPIYAGILKGIEYFNDKEINISSACLFLTGMLVTTARPFAKYILDPWRKFWKTKQ